MTTELTTLVSSSANWKGLAWNNADSVKRVTIEQIFDAANRGTFGSTPLERLVIEGGLENSKFLELITSLSSSFRGDVLFIDCSEHAFRR